MIIYKEIQISELPKIKHLWESLNQLHLEDSVYFTEHYKQFTFEKRSARWMDFNDENILILIAEAEVPVGYCISTRGMNNEGEIDSLYVDPEYRGKNIGKELTLRSLNWLKSNNCHPIRLAVSYGHESVLGFYKRIGFYPRLTVLEWKP